MTLFRPGSSLVADLVTGRETACMFVHDLGALRQQARTVGAALPAGSELFYAVKANSDARILQTLAPYVAGFEVASAGEVRKVRDAVGDAARIIMGGPVRTATDIEFILEAGVERLHVESLQMLRVAQSVAARAGRILPILLRVNLTQSLACGTLTMGGSPTQFGIAQPEIPEALALLFDCPALRFDGFHFHTISNNRDAVGHAALCAVEIGLARSWAADHELALRIVNLGGGWGVDYADPDWRFDVEAFTAALDSHGVRDVSLQFECGRIIAAYHAAYICEIVDIKSTHGKAFALLRGGTHHFRLPSSWSHDHPFLILARDDWAFPWRRPGVDQASLTLAGELCTPKDVLARDVHVESARIGDLVCFLMAGAYGWDISHHDFLSHPHPDRIFLEGARE